MNQRSKDTSLIAVALIAILGCGFGLGKQFAPRKPANGGPPKVALADLEEGAFAELKKALALTADQEDSIRSEIAGTKDEILATRKRAMFEYHLHMLRLHDKIAPKLDDEQRRVLNINRKLLQTTIEKRFPKMLNNLPQPLGGGSESPE